MADTEITVSGFDVSLAAGLKPMNDLDFPLVQGKDILIVGKNKRLNTVIEELEELTNNGGTAVEDVKKRLTQAETAIGRKPEIKDDAASATSVFSSTKVNELIVAAKDAVKADLLGGAGEAYDTLKEIADLAVNNKTALDALQNIAGNHVRYDQAQTLTAEQQTQARTNIAAVSAAEVAAAVKPAQDKADETATALDALKTAVGDTTTDYTATFEAALAAADAA